MANDFSQRHDPFVAKIVTDPKQHVDTSLLQGYLGSSSEDNSTRIYLDPALSQYMDVPNEQIIHVEPLPKDQSPLGGSFIWLRKDAEVVTGKAGGQRRKSTFLEGSLQAEYAANPNYKPTIPVFCGERTPEIRCPVTSNGCHYTQVCPTYPHCTQYCTYHYACYPQQGGGMPTSSPEACPAAQPAYGGAQMPGVEAGPVAYQTTQPNCILPVTHAPLCTHTVYVNQCLHTVYYQNCYVTLSPICHITKVCPYQTVACFTPGITAACNPGPVIPGR